MTDGRKMDKNRANQKEAQRCHGKKSLAHRNGLGKQFKDIIITRSEKVVAGSCLSSDAMCSLDPQSITSLPKA